MSDAPPGVNSAIASGAAFKGGGPPGGMAAGGGGGAFENVLSAGMGGQEMQGVNSVSPFPSPDQMFLEKLQGQGILEQNVGEALDVGKMAFAGGVGVNNLGDCAVNEATTLQTGQLAPGVTPQMKMDASIAGSLSK